ncbi:MAG: bactofilin family protein [Methylocystis sp.]|uniref:bactofilin family protein n=1 Tax=Methylocystis sp. TaxID=1911079 RepID=UPI003DA48FF0
MATFRPDQENSVYIGQGVELTGEIRARDVIVIDGDYDGEIVCSHLVVGPTGTVKGKITATSAEISGHVSAEITTKQLMAVRSTGRVEGSWDCGAIEVARGAVLSGSANVAESTPAQRGEAQKRLPEPAYVEVEDEEEEEATVAAVPALTGPRRLTRLALRSPRRSAG